MTQTNERQGMDSDNAATMRGYTREVCATSGAIELFLLVQPGTDYDTTFKAWDTDAQEWIAVDGWLFEFEAL